MVHWQQRKGLDQCSISQTVNPSVSLHSLLITELHWITIQMMWVWRVVIEYAVVCIMYSRWGIRHWYEAQILHEGCAALGQCWILSRCFTEPRAEKMYLTGCYINKSYWMSILGVWTVLLHLPKVLCWTSKLLYNNSDWPVQVLETLWCPHLSDVSQCVKTCHLPTPL